MGRDGSGSESHRIWALALDCVGVTWYTNVQSRDAAPLRSALITLTAMVSAITARWISSGTMNPEAFMWPPDSG